MNTRQRTPFEVASRLAERFMNQFINEIPDFGIRAEVKGWDIKQGKLMHEYMDRSVEAILVSTNLIIVRGSTQDNWLCESLSTALRQNVELSQATAVNRWLIDVGFIEKRATIEHVLVNNRITDRKVWMITQEWLELIEKAHKDEVKVYDIRKDIADVCIKNNVKGTSIASYKSIGALEKLNETALRFHPATLEFAERHEEIVRNKNVKPSRNRNGEVTRAASQITADKIREIDAVVAKFEEIGSQPFYLEHEQDTRGRIYAKGGWISTQSSKLQKAAIRFAMPEASTNDDEILIYLGRLHGCKGTNQEAMLAGYTEYDNPSSIEAVSVISQPDTAIIRLDGTCNGIQWISAFGNDAEGMRLTNLTDHNINDLYTAVKDKLGLETRDMAKRIVMPRGYGASAWSIANNLREEGMRIDQDEVAVMLDEVAEILPIDKFLNFIEGKGKYRLKGKDRLTWTMPDGFSVVHEYRTYNTIKGGKSFEVKLGDGEVDSKKMLSALAPNIIHSIDSYHARLVITQCNFPVIAIHDSFGCHPSNVPMLRKVIRETFKQIIKEDVLNNIMEQIGMPRYADPVDPELITNEYMFM